MKDELPAVYVRLIPVVWGCGHGGVVSEAEVHGMTEEEVVAYCASFNPCMTCLLEPYVPLMAKAHLKGHGCER